jgi:GNAT superfamily N-acetyltransferase
MRAQEFITEYKKSREDFEGITIEMVKNGHVLVINALDDWGNNVLGSVAFNIGDNNELDPQELKVDERYQGQGIARAMYDYAKSKGYEIHRSYDQTPAGAGFWNKHRGEDVRVWEAFDQPYKGKWEKSEYGDVDLNTKLPDGTYLNIMFNQEYDGEGNEVTQVEFHRNNSQEVTGEGDAQRIFATVLNAIQKYIKKYKPSKLSFSASKATDPTIYYEPGQPQPNTESRTKLYDRLIQRYARAWGYQASRADNGDLVIYELSRLKQGMAENFADGKNPGRKGLSKRVGIPKKTTLAKLEKIAQSSTGERRRMAQWQLNMRRGKKK